MRDHLGSVFIWSVYVALFSPMMAALVGDLSIVAFAWLGALGFLLLFSAVLIARDALCKFRARLRRREIGTPQWRRFLGYN